MERRFGIRLFLIGMVLLLTVGGASIVPSSSVAHGAMSAKKTCKTVKKKVHGKVKRVKVCKAAKRKAAKPKPTATPTDTPLPTDTPTLTPTPTNTPTPTATPVPRIQGFNCTYTNAPQATGRGLFDGVTGIGTCVETADGNGDTNFVRYLDSDGIVPPASHAFLFVWVNEHNVIGISRYFSSIFSFEVRGPDGEVYAAQVGAPSGSDDSQELNGVEIDGKGDQNAGWIKFVIPAVAGNYTVLWNENGTLPFTPVTDLPVAQNALLGPGARLTLARKRAALRGGWNRANSAPPGLTWEASGR